MVDEDRVYPSEEQGIVPEVHGDKERELMSSGEKEEEIYDETGREMELEDDEINSSEAAFVDGFESGGLDEATLKVFGSDLSLVRDRVDVFISSVDSNAKVELVDDNGDRFVKCVFRFDEDKVGIEKVKSDLLKIPEVVFVEVLEVKRVSRG